MEVVEVGILIKKIRQNQRLSAKDLSAKSGVSAKQISCIENRHVSDIKLQTLSKLILSLGYSLAINKDVDVLTDGKIDY